MGKPVVRELHGRGHTVGEAEGRVLWGLLHRVDDGWGILPRHRTREKPGLIP